MAPGGHAAEATRLPGGSMGSVVAAGAIADNTRITRAVRPIRKFMRRSRVRIAVIVVGRA
jgi:hypothetical protein